MKQQLFHLLLFLGIAATATAQEQVYLKGNIVPATGIALEHQGGDVWAGDVELDDSRVFLFSDKYVYFECTARGYRSDHIRINGGRYHATVNLQNQQWQFTAPVDSFRISAFGSSVCNGQGATGNQGYAWLYGQQLQERHADGTSPWPFYVSGISIGGNNTQNLLDRYDDLTRNHSRYVIVGLSMGNEGVHEAADKQQTLRQFSTNMQTIIRRIKADGMTPVVMNNYTRGDFTPDDYACIKQMNLEIHDWDVASVNTLGAIDDGAGRWASGYMADNAHPTTNGHREFFYAMTPSLFDALAEGKPQPVRQADGQLAMNPGDALTFRGEGTVHPFAIALRVKADGQGRLMSFSLTTGTRQGTVTVDADGHAVYTNPNGRTLASAVTLTDGQWHTVTLTHYYAQGRTLLYVDTAEAGVLRERLNALADVSVGPDAAPMQLSELFFWRSALSPDEVAALCEGAMLKSSLELYVPMRSDASLENLAMSLNAVSHTRADDALQRLAPAVAPAPQSPRRLYALSGAPAAPHHRGLRIAATPQGRARKVLPRK